MTIFIYGLNYRARREHIVALCSPYGNVLSARIIVDQEAKRSKGYGFVEMETLEQAEAAIAAIEGMTHMGRVIHAVHAHERAKNE